MRFGKIINIQFGCFQMAVEKKDVYKHMIISSPIVFLQSYFINPKIRLKTKKNPQKMFVSLEVYILSSNDVDVNQDLVVK